MLNRAKTKKRQGLEPGLLIMIVVVAVLYFLISYNKIADQEALLSEELDSAMQLEF